MLGGGRDKMAGCCECGNEL